MRWINKFIWKEADKVYHAYLHTTIVLVSSLSFNQSILVSGGISLVWGFLWEIKDMITKKQKFDWLDIAANFYGTFIGVALLIIIGWIKQMFGG